MQRQQSRRAVKELAKRQSGKKNDRMSTSEYLRFVQVLGKASSAFQVQALKNRPDYGQDLMRYYTAHAELLRDIGRYFILTPNGGIGPDAVMELHRPYQILPFALYSALADNLTYDEEESFRRVMAEVREAWNAMTGAMRVARPERFGDLENLKSHALACVDFIEDFYLGEIETELSDEFNAHAAFLYKCLEKIGGAL